MDAAWKYGLQGIAISVGFVGTNDLDLPDGRQVREVPFSSDEHDGEQCIALHHADCGPLERCFAGARHGLAEPCVRSDPDSACRFGGYFELGLANTHVHSTGTGAALSRSLSEK